MFEFQRKLTGETFQHKPLLDQAFTLARAVTWRSVKQAEFPFVIQVNAHIKSSSATNLLVLQSDS